MTLWPLPTESVEVAALTTKLDFGCLGRAIDLSTVVKLPPSVCGVQEFREGRGRTMSNSLPLLMPGLESMSQSTDPDRQK